MASDAASTGIEQSPPYTRLGGSLDWLRERQRAILALGVAFQVLVLAAMMVRPLMTLSTGDAILLRVAPIDPRDLFRGDYVILSYEISRPGWNQGTAWQTNWERARQMEGKTIYVLLEPDEDGKHWHSAGLQFELPTEGKFIRGTMNRGGIAEFGIEKYFVQEGTGHDYERAVQEKKLSAEVAVDKNGAAQIKRLIIE